MSAHPSRVGYLEGKAFLWKDLWFWGEFITLLLMRSEDSAGPRNCTPKALALPLAQEPVEGEEVWELSPWHGLPVPRQKNIEDAAVAQPQTTPASRAARAGCTGAGAWSHTGHGHCWAEKGRDEGRLHSVPGGGTQSQGNSRSHPWQLRCYQKKP